MRYPLAEKGDFRCLSIIETENIIDAGGLLSSGTHFEFHRDGAVLKWRFLWLIPEGGAQDHGLAMEIDAVSVLEPGDFIFGMNVKGPEAGDKGDGKDSQEGNTEKGRALALEKGTAEMYQFEQCQSLVCLQMVLDKSGLKPREAFSTDIPLSRLLGNPQ